MLHPLPQPNRPPWKNPLQSLLKLAPRKRPLPSRYFWASLAKVFCGASKRWAPLSHTTSSFLFSFHFCVFKDDSAAVVEEKQEATPEAAPATEEVAAPAAEESKQEEVDAPVAEAVVASEVETQPAQPVSLKKRKFKKKKTQTCFRVW